MAFSLSFLIYQLIRLKQISNIQEISVSNNAWVFNPPKSMAWNCEVTYNFLIHRGIFYQFVMLEAPICIDYLDDNENNIKLM